MSTPSARRCGFCGETGHGIDEARQYCRRRFASEDWPAHLPIRRLSPDEVIPEGRGDFTFGKAAGIFTTLPISRRRADGC